MGKVEGKLTVFFEEPFWVGVFERIENGKLSVAKVTFGAEPKDSKVYDFILKHYYSLRFSPAVSTVVKETKKNPKRMRREVQKHFRIPESVQNRSRRLNYSRSRTNVNAKQKAGNKNRLKRSVCLN